MGLASSCSVSSAKNMAADVMWPYLLAIRSSTASGNDSLGIALDARRLAGEDLLILPAWNITQNSGFWMPPQVKRYVVHFNVGPSVAGIICLL
jgi:hypothetical protein